MVLAMTSDATKLKAALTRWAGDVTEDANRRLPALVAPDTPRDTGELSRSLEHRPVTGGGTRFVAHLVATVIQAATTDKGARPHVIRPKGPGYPLRFYWPKVGRVVAFMHVNHPGNPPQGWWKRSLERRWPQALRAAARGRRL